MTLIVILVDFYGLERDNLMQNAKFMKGDLSGNGLGNGSKSEHSHIWLKIN